MTGWLQHLLRDAGRVELRHHDGQRWTSGIFDDEHALRATVERLAGVGNLFTSLNAPKPLPAGNAMNGRALRDMDIGWITRLPFDFDPVRPTGVPSTDDELQTAIARRDRLVQALRAIGWPTPATAISGNGAHAIYRCRLPANDETADMLRSIYTGMQIEFTTKSVIFDVTVRNPARIWRLYGVFNRKGTPTLDRPHRRALVRIPGRWAGVSAQQVERLADAYAKALDRQLQQQHVERPAARVPAGSSGDYNTLDVVAWFAAHQSYRRPLADGKHAARCPWTHEHSTEPTANDTSTVVWQSDGNGWPTFHCSHAHCHGRRITDVMRHWGDADRFCGRAWRKGVTA
ncbi:MAG: hypothetical protein LC125_06750 [Burkholderiales bacterium]|nr:hypothetical protein [Burkholderiales bacterium]